MEGAPWSMGTILALATIALSEKLTVLNSAKASVSEVRTGGLEPPHLAVPDPKSGASTNSATSVRCKGLQR